MAMVGDCVGSACLRCAPCIWVQWELVVVFLHCLLVQSLKLCGSVRFCPPHV